ncbi:hypothetical protein B5F88_02185 [Flavonifractor sp. An306]|nr:hypothetical protein B5F88_02185 [Flavonifractor sp. An306]
MGDAGAPLCQNCYEGNYTTCCQCGGVIRESEACHENSDEHREHPYCSQCFRTAHQEQPIHNHSYKPEPIFHGKGPRFFGVELEMDGGGECSTHASCLLAIANQEKERSYIKHDGSLNDGFELVTHPMSLDIQLHEMPWRQLCRHAVSLGYRSHQASTCGLHIHVSRKAFGATEQEQDAAIARVLYFFERHWEELLKFSRRTPRQLERWASRYGYKEQPMEILDFAKKGYHGGRYACVNLRNADTVEFRIFRGTLKPNTIFATLELVDCICDLAVCMSDQELKAITWNAFVSTIITGNLPELVRYLKERGICGNVLCENSL